VIAWRKERIIIQLAVSASSSAVSWLVRANEFFRLESSRMMAFGWLASVGKETGQIVTQWSVVVPDCGCNLQETPLPKIAYNARPWILPP
jgi:hypothetical protein